MGTHGSQMSMSHGNYREGGMRAVEKDPIGECRAVGNPRGRVIHGH